MTRTILAAAAVSLLAGATLGASAAAADPALAIALENQSREQGERIRAQDTFRRSSLERAPGFAFARSIVNGSADTQDGRILGTGTLLSGDGHSERAREIFARLAEESRDQG